jgi:HlyD family type I secretion membrane fusion protein
MAALVNTVPPPSGADDPMVDARRAIRAGVVVLVVAFGGAGGWAVLAPLSGAVIVPGIVEVDSYRKTVQHLEGGIVKEILVRPGDHVAKGQPLLVLDDIQAASAVGVLRVQLDGELAKQARLVAEIARADAIRFPEELAQRRTESAKLDALIQAEESLFAARRQLMEGQVAILRAQVQDVDEEIRGLAAQIESVDRNIGFVKEQLAINETLSKKSFATHNAVLDSRRQLAQKQEDRGEYVSRLGAGKQKLKDIELRIGGLYDTHVREAADEFKLTRQRIADLEDRIRPSEDQLKRSVVVAPIAGEVVDLQVHSTGGVIAPRQPLMDLVPADAGLIIEGKLRLDDIKHVQVGADVDVQLTAYKRRITPRVPGKLTYISADSLTEQAPGGEVRYYQVYIAVQQKDLEEAGGLVLNPGMPVQAFIRTAGRTFLEYLMQPITDSMRRAFREY